MSRGGRHGRHRVEGRARDVPLIDALRPYAEAAARGKRGSDLLLDGPDGGRRASHNARRAVGWEEIREAIGRPDLRIHDLRHTFAAILFDTDAPAPDVPATLGHSGLQVTEPEWHSLTGGPEESHADTKNPR